MLGFGRVLVECFHKVLLRHLIDDLQGFAFLCGFALLVAALVCFLLDGDVILMRKFADGFGKSQALFLHHKSNGIPMLPTAVTMVGIGVGIDKERGRLFIMERTTAGQPVTFPA